MNLNYQLIESKVIIKALKSFLKSVSEALQVIQSLKHYIIYAGKHLTRVQSNFGY